MRKKGTGEARRLLTRQSTVLLFVFQAAFLLAAAATTSAESHALLIGLNYQGYQGGPGVSVLPGIGLDIDKMEQVARDLGIRNIRKLWNEEATLAAIRAAFQELALEAGREDLTLIYFSGHGARTPDTGEGDFEADGQDEALVPFDFRLGPVGPENALLDDEVGRLLGSIRSEQVLLVVDACHSGTAAKSIGPVAKAVYLGTAKDIESPSGSILAEPSASSVTGKFIGFMASQDSEYSYATPEGSVLTNAFHDALSAAVATGLREITMEDLFGRVEHRVEDRMRRISGSQHPNLFLLPGNESLRRLELRLGGGSPDGDRLDPPEDDTLINQWSSIAAGVPERLDMRLRRETFKPHPNVTGRISDCDDQYLEHLLTLEVEVPRDGYLNIVNAGQGETAPIVLFPNKLSQDNAVGSGERVTIPPPGTSQCLPAWLPTGMKSQWVLLVAAFSEQPLNFYKEGTGDFTFRTLTEESSRSFGVSGTVSAPASGRGVSATATAHVLISRR